MKSTVHDLEVMGSNPGQVKLRMYGTSVSVVLEPKILCIVWFLYQKQHVDVMPFKQASNHTINRAAFVCLSVCLFVPYLLRGPLTDLRQTWWVYCRWTSELPLRGSFSKRSTARRVNRSLSLSTILYMCQPHSTQLQKATLLLLHLIRLKGTFCCIDGWWVYVGGSRNWLLDG